MIRNKVLLVGNGINNVRNRFAWKQLIQDLISHIGAAGQIAIRDKPFPLLYEEIFIEAVKYKGFSEKEIKEFIAGRISELKKGPIHEEVIKHNFQNILTTNYDYNLEKVKINDTSYMRNEGVVTEKTYNLFRHSKIGNTNIWHIHGECNLPSSITLGYEHYSGYLQQMRNYVVTGTGSSYKNVVFEPLKKRFQKGYIKSDSWVDFFFKKNIHILGFTFDFVEMHLWWIITYRARVKYEKNNSVGNKIIYYYPEKEAAKIQNKLDLLRSNDVIPFSIRLNKRNWAQYYLEALEKIKKSK